MSRARQDAHVHVVADNVDQAVEDLSWNWSRERRQTWAIDTGTPDDQRRNPLEIEADRHAPGKLRAVLGRARLKAERAALAATAPGGIDPAQRHQIAALDRHIQILDQHREPWKNPFPERRIGAAHLDVASAERTVGPSI
jgi:hypothetical protein